MFPRFYPILDTGLLEARGITLAAAADAVLSAGVRIVQVRHKRFFSRAVLEQGERVAAMCRDAGVRLVVNDRVDMALLLGAGVHVGQDDLPPASVRQLVGPSGMVGFSTHNEEQFRRAAGEPVDYVAFGPVFATASKENPDPVSGLAGVRRAAALAAGRPLIAIGGISLENAGEVFAAGADSVAVIAGLAGACTNARELGQRAELWLEICAG